MPEICDDILLLPVGNYSLNLSLGLQTSIMYVLCRFTGECTLNSKGITWSVLDGAYRSGRIGQ